MRPTLAALGLMIALLIAQVFIWFPFMPNAFNRVSVDFSYWLPNLLAGYYWYLHNGVFNLPWFSPSECAGVPFHADPQFAFLSLPQFLTFFMPPLDAVRTTFLLFSAIGFWGAWHLARRTFAMSLPAALLAAGLFQLNDMFAVRMIVAHISFAPFMLLPALAAAMLRPPGLAAPVLTETIFRVVFGGVLVAICILGGMVHLIPPLYLSLVAVFAIHALCHGTQKAALARLAGATFIGLALSAGKLVAGLALLSNFPRSDYRLPGIDGLFTTLYVALRALFTPASHGLSTIMAHSQLIQEQHEFAYSVGFGAPLLMLAVAVPAVILWWRLGRPKLPPAPRTLAIALAVMLAVPVVLNVYEPHWNALLKSLPVLGSSSTLLRWFSADILPAVLGAALALQYITRTRRNLAFPLAGGALALLLLGSAFGDHNDYGFARLGFYDPSALNTAWQIAHEAGTPPPITFVTKMSAPNGALIMAPERQNGLVQGYSTLFCYQPIFGYRLEKFPFGPIRLDAAMSVHDGVRNFKNPACYVYPGANQCAPGDQFTEAQGDALSQFLDYRPYSFNKPFFAVAADWLGIVAALACIAALGWTVRKHFFFEKKKQKTLAN
jgi:hypothetical protein